MDAERMLLGLVLLPVVAAVCIAAAPRGLARGIGVVSSLVLLAYSIWVAMQFPEWKSGAFWPAAGDASGLPLGLGATLALAADGVSMTLVLLTAFLTPLALLGSWTAIAERQKEFYAWFMLLTAATMLAFTARDAISFLVGFEFTLVPMLFLIGIFGSEERRAAAIKFFLFTFVGGVFTLTGVIWLAAERAAEIGTWSFLISDLQAFATSRFGAEKQSWLFALLMVGFLVKVPVFPLHTWLPVAHTQAPTAGSVILAGTLLKLGGYGIYRVALPVAPLGAAEFVTVLAGLSIIGIVAIGAVCLVQRDMKKLIAYSSVAHMGVCILGMMALNPAGVTGSVFYMVSHGLSTGALFLCVGFMYERHHTKDMDLIGGLAKSMPIWAFFTVFFTMASVGLPGLVGFPAEFLCLFGAFTATPDGVPGWPGLLGPRWVILAAFAALVIGAAYMLYMVGRAVFGPARLPHGDGHHGHHASGLPADLNGREILTLGTLAVACLVFGLRPAPLLDAIGPSVAVTLKDLPAAVERMQQAEAPPELAANR
jgi:NADH-quinone oxidoreductase subunit M